MKQLFLQLKGVLVNKEFLGKHAKCFKNALLLSFIGEYSEYKKSIKIEKNRITITIPFNGIGVNALNIVSDKVYNKVTNKTEDMMLDLIRDNPILIRF